MRRILMAPVDEVVGLRLHLLLDERVGWVHLARILSLVGRPTQVRLRWDVLLRRR
mgnify:CR=1 FL=1